MPCLRLRNSQYWDVLLQVNHGPLMLVKGKIRKDQCHCRYACGTQQPRFTIQPTDIKCTAHQIPPTILGVKDSRMCNLTSYYIDWNPLILVPLYQNTTCSLYVLLFRCTSICKIFVLFFLNTICPMCKVSIHNLC